MNTPQEKSAAATFPLAAFGIKDLIWTIAFLIAGMAAPAFLAHSPQNQWITGTIVNAIIYLAVWRVGVVNAAFVTALPSSIALLHGLLPAPMAILIPYIILSNIILAGVFFALKKHPLWGVTIASLAKFIFLFTITAYFLKVASPLLTMMQWPQLVTALAGGLFAVGIIRLSSFRNRRGI